MNFPFSPTLNPDNEPYAIIYDCGEADLVLETSTSKKEAKIKRKTLKSWFNRKLKIIPTGEVRQMYPTYKMESVIIDVRRY